MKLDNNELVILKVHRFGDMLYNQEVWAINERRKQGVPVPQVLLVEKVLIDNELRDIMILEKVIDEQNVSQNDIFRI
jgi:hypothetical protein